MGPVNENFLCLDPGETKINSYKVKVAQTMQINSVHEKYIHRLSFDSCQYGFLFEANTNS